MSSIDGSHGPIVYGPYNCRLGIAPALTWLPPGGASRDALAELRCLSLKALSACVYSNLRILCCWLLTLHPNAPPSITRAVPSPSEQTALCAASCTACGSGVRSEKQAQSVFLQRLFLCQEFEFLDLRRSSTVWTLVTTLTTHAYL